MIFEVGPYEDVLQCFATMSILQHTADFHKALADWYAMAKRPLPWRTNPSLYNTVVSEFMLQQTQVKTMIPYYHRWVNRFSDFEALAGAPADDVLKHWEGLGYYSRARNLHKLAKAYVALDVKPTTAAEWRLLPGVGPYTAAAISSIAQGHAAAVVDGNVVRILARLTNEPRNFKNGAEAIKTLTPIAEAVLNKTHPGNHNQAMMELGATVCTKHKPLCTICPAVNFCLATANGTAETLPKIQRKATQQVQIDRYWIVTKDKILLHRIAPEASQLAGQHELPASAHFAEAPTHTRHLTTKTRSITHRRIKERILATSMPETVSPQKDLIWVPFDKLDSITLSGPHRRWVREILEKTNSQHG